MNDNQFALYLAFCFVWGWFCALTFSNFFICMGSALLGGYVSWEFITYFIR